MIHPNILSALKKTNKVLRSSIYTEITYIIERRPSDWRKRKLASSGKPERKMPLSTIAKFNGGTKNWSSYEWSNTQSTSSSFPFKRSYCWWLWLLLSNEIVLQLPQSPHLDEDFSSFIFLILWVERKKERERDEEFEMRGVKC